MLLYFIIGGLSLALSIFLFLEIKKNILIKKIKKLLSLESNSALKLLEELSKRYIDCGSKIVESESLCRNIYSFLNEIPFGILSINIEKHEIISMNEMCKKMLSVNENEVTGKKCYIVCKDYKFLANIENAINKHKTTGINKIEQELTLGGSRPIYVKINYIFPEQNEDEMVTIMTDITYQKEIEEKSSKLISDVAHELRTPLTSIHGFAETLLQPGINEEDRKKFLMIIESESARLGRLINEILDIVRMENKKTSMVFSKINLSEIVSYVAELVEDEASSKNIKIIKKIEPNIYISGNEDKLIQAFLNLTDNAIKYTQSVGDTVSIKLSKDSTNAILEISDNGPGIPSVYLDRIFERFFRVDKSRNRNKIEGAGLGLSIVKTIIEHHKGFIEAESEVGKGTTFTIALPLLNENKNNVI
jgi:two-component system phosphate regulon sensor histidine kinase PhoR